MLDPIHLENEKLLIHSFRPEDLGRFEQLTKDVFDILSDTGHDSELSFREELHPFHYP